MAPAIDASGSKHSAVSFRNVDDERPAAHGLSRDERELAHFGKRQKLRRNFGMASIIALTCTLMITWEGVLIIFAEGFENGGPLGLLCTYALGWIGVTSQVLVMAELGSMIPLAGGQYNWVAILAPRWCSKFLSYLTGWITMIAWQASTASAVYLTGSMIQGLAVLAHPTYVPTVWQSVLLFYAVIAVALLVNTLLARFLPQVESLILIVHVVGFFGILVPLVYLPPKHTTDFSVWLNEGEWASRGLTFFVGATSNYFTFVGVDAASHMAEEIQNASSVIPKAMVASVLINGVTGLAMLIAVLYALTDLKAAFNTPTGYPFMEIFVQGVNSNSGATGMATVITAAMTFATIGVLATSSRMLWAFARERAVPGHRWISRVHPRTYLPLYSIGVCVVINVLFALINLGSTAAFSAFTGLTIAAFYSVFIISASVLLYRKLSKTEPPLRYGPFRLGSFEIPITVFSIAFSIVGWFFSFWPQSSAPTLVTFNWSVVVYAAAVVFSLVYYQFVAKGRYTGPIMEITPEQATTELKSPVHSGAL